MTADEKSLAKRRTETLAPEVLYVAGWISWEEAWEKRGDAYCSDLHDKILIDHIRKHGIKIDGFDHQDARNQGTKGAPLFSDGAVVADTMRNWGDIMATAWRTPEEDFTYVDWAWSVPDGHERKLP